MLEKENAPELSNEEEVKKEGKVPQEEAAPASNEAEAPKADKKQALNPDEFYELEKATNHEEIVSQIEEKRKGLLVSFNKSKIASRISMAVVVVAVVAAIVMIFNELMVLKIIGYSIAGAVLVGMLVYYIISKDKFPKQSKEYIADVTKLINGYDFVDPRFSEIKVYPNKKKQKTDLDVDRVYKNALEIGSRNYIEGRFDGHKFEVSENVLYSLSGTKRTQRSVLFLGKYISMENKLKFENRYIFNIKGNDPEKLVDQPNDIEDLQVVLEEDNLVVYGPNDKPVKDVFGTKFLSKLKEIKTDEKLLNCVFVAWAGHSAFYLSYDDSVTVLPFEHPFNQDAQEKYKTNLIQALELLTSK